MVHAYLMYGFPTQTEQETIDSLEVVRQMFDAGVMQSGFWHRFAMTAHSPVGIAPDKFKVSVVDPTEGTFANNDLEHHDPEGGDHGKFSAGLKKSLYNYMHGVGFDFELQEWFEHKVPSTTHSPDLIESYLDLPRRREIKSRTPILWIGGPVELRQESDKKIQLIIYDQQTTKITVDNKIGEWLVSLLNQMEAQRLPMSYKELQLSYEESGLTDFTLFWYSTEMEALKELGLLQL